MKPSSAQFLVTVCLLTATLAASKLSDRRVPESLARPLHQIDSEIAGWRAAQDLAVDSRNLERLKPTSFLSRNYRKNGQQLNLFIAFYAQQRAGETMHSPKQCLPGSGWEIWRHGSAEVSWQGRSVTINQYSIQRATQRMLVFYWYQSRDRVISSEYLGKILLVRDALIDGRTGGMIVRITAPDVPGADREGLQFAFALIPLVERCIRADSGPPLEAVRLTPQ